ALQLDGVEPARAEPDGELPEEAVLALADRVRRWHEAQRPADVRLEVEPGVELERRWVPLRSVGVYVPRGLVSTLVMCAVPARVAGVERIAVVTPPAGAGLVASAAELLGLDEVWAVGGAQAIAALAYGTAKIWSALSRTSSGSHPSTSYCSARRRRSRRASETRARCSSARARRSRAATTRPAGTMCCRRAAGRARSAGSDWRHS